MSFVSCFLRNRKWGVCVPSLPSYRNNASKTCRLRYSNKRSFHVFSISSSKLNTGRHNWDNTRNVSQWGAQLKLLTSLIIRALCRINPVHCWNSPIQESPFNVISVSLGTSSWCVMFPYNDVTKLDSIVLIEWLISYFFKIHSSALVIYYCRHNKLDHNLSVIRSLDCAPLFCDVTHINLRK